MQIDYQRNLPHLLPVGEQVFITYRLAGSVPTDTLLRLLEEKQTRLRQLETTCVEEATLFKAKYNEEKRYFAAFDNYLDNVQQGPQWLKNQAVAEVVKEGIHYRDGVEYDLHAYCVMSNHVHLLVSIRENHKPFHYTLKSLKGYSARRANKILSRTGQPFWQSESYDHVVRNQKEFKRIISYILNNPVKVGFVANWEEWPHNYVADGV